MEDGIPARARAPVAVHHAARGLPPAGGLAHQPDRLARHAEVRPAEEREPQALLRLGQRRGVALGVLEAGGEIVPRDEPGGTHVAPLHERTFARDATIDLRSAPGREAQGARHANASIGDTPAPRVRERRVPERRGRQDARPSRRDRRDGEREKRPARNKRAELRHLDARRRRQRRPAPRIREAQLDPEWSARHAALPADALSQEDGRQLGEEPGMKACRRCLRPCVEHERHDDIPLGHGRRHRGASHCAPAPRRGRSPGMRHAPPDEDRHGVPARVRTGLLRTRALVARRRVAVRAPRRGSADRRAWDRAPRNCRASHQSSVTRCRWLRIGSPQCGRTGRPPGGCGALLSAGGSLHLHATGVPSARSSASPNGTRCTTSSMSSAPRDP